MIEGHTADLHDPAEAAAWLKTTGAIRLRSNAILELGRQGQLKHFTVFMDRLPDVAAYVAGVMRENYPDLAIPYHARWRHFAVGGSDRWAELAGTLHGVDRDEIARIRFDLCVTSVLLDAGAGMDWRYKEAETGVSIGRSEGLALASLAAFKTGLFSGDATAHLRADAAGLAALKSDALAESFQVRS